MNTLIIDDSRACRAILRTYLKALDHTIFEAADGKQALALLQQNRDINAALVDWNMPEMNGYELVQAVRADPSLAAVRLIMVTTETEMDHVAMAIEAGADEYIMKPFTREMIEEKLRMVGIGAAI